jgi:transposase
MYRIQLTAAQREELQRRAHDPAVKPRTRDRLEMVRLSHAGWSVPRIARHLGICEKRVRHWIKRFLLRGFDALPDRRHPGQRSALTPVLEEALRAELRKGERTWTARQLAEWLADQFGVRFHPRYLGQRLRRARISYKRTSRSLKHKQEPEAVAAQKKERAAQEKRGIRARSMSPIWTRWGSRRRCRPAIAGIQSASGSPSRMKRPKGGG